MYLTYDSATGITQTENIVLGKAHQGHGLGAGIRPSLHQGPLIRKALGDHSIERRGKTCVSEQCLILFFFRLGLLKLALCRQQRGFAGFHLCFGGQILPLVIVNLLLGHLTRRAEVRDALFSRVYCRCATLYCALEEVPPPFVHG